MTMVASAGPGGAGAARAGGWHSVVSRFEEAATAHPDRAALICDGTVTTFGELAARTGAIAAGLTARGVGAESLIGLLLPCGADLVAGIFGTLRSGASYLPLDPALPASRLRYMCRQAGTALVLSDAATRRRIPRTVASGILTIGTCARTSQAGGAGPAAIEPGQRAYALYTSGSTGQPKAVEVTHGSLAWLLDGLTPVIGPAPARVGWNANPSFDASVQQWLRLCRGDTLVLLGADVREDPQALGALIARERLDELDITPSHLVMLLDNLPREHRKTPLRLLVGGEAISAGLWDRLAARRAAGELTAINLYGPTECTVDTTWAPIDALGRPHLGGPLAGARVHLLDERLRPVRPGTDGELYLTGPGVARGYLGRPALTAQRFVPDVTGDGDRMYRTGDRARIGPGGWLEYVGRSDDQVKLRGYRIELGEIETVLSRCPHVDQAAVVVRSDMPGGAALVGYCRVARTAADEPTAFDAGAVQRAAAAQLPAYMVPTALVPMAEFPLTGNGKVNRAALPPPSRPVRPEPAGGTPQTGTERMVAAAWRELLGIEQVGRDDHFFELGGQSMLAIRLVAHLRRAGAPAIPLVAVFSHPVLGELAGYIDAHQGGS